MRAEAELAIKTRLPSYDNRDDSISNAKRSTGVLFSLAREAIHEVRLEIMPAFGGTIGPARAPKTTGLAR